MKKILLLLAACAAVLTSAQDAKKDDNPGSLWKSNARDYLRDRVARREGDLITIIISESSSSSFQAATNASKNDSTNIAKGLGPLLGNLISNWGIGASSGVDGKGATTQAGRMTARMTAIVKQVLPNGTMIIEGTRAVTTNKETQVFTLSGVIRQDDVRADNTILSEFIADAQIKADSKGMISERQRKGILTRLLDWLF
jgi:flagellar L-ring protein precursor FlgH